MHKYSIETICALSTSSIKKKVLPNENLVPVFTPDILKKLYLI